MAERRRSGPVMHLVSIAAASVAVVALVGLAPPATDPGIVASVQAEPPATSVPLRPSYIVRDASPAIVMPVAPVPVQVSLSVQPVAAVEPPAPAAEKWYVTAGALNVRAGPSSATEQLAALPRGTAVEISGAEGKWTEITTADGLRGWVFTKYLSPTAPQ
jgi:uncharacterized protein YgiM (DUF1202 family)